MKVNKNIVIGYPRTGFTLLISIVNEILSYQKDKNYCDPYLKSYCDTIGNQISKAIEAIFVKRGLGDQLLYNGNFKQMVGGPKWIREGHQDIACFRKYIGVKGMGDFTLITSHPIETLDYYEVIHSHVAPSLWPKHDTFKDRTKFTSMRNPAGTISSACFSLNALASEYIQKHISSENDNDEMRQKLALYKLTDMNFFESLVIPFKKYLDEFATTSHHYTMMRWEDLILNPINTILAIATEMKVPLELQQAQHIWQKIDHVNLTGAHKHNLRKGYGIVDNWKQWLTNDHITMLKDYGIDKLCKPFGYDLTLLDETQYTPFQSKVAKAITEHTIIREYEDDDLFTFAFNKSNLDLSRFDFKRYEWKEHTQIERSSFTDDELVMEVWEVAEKMCGDINKEFEFLHGFNSVDNEGKELKINLIAEHLKNDSIEPYSIEEFKKACTVHMCNKTNATIKDPVLVTSIGSINIVEFNGVFYNLPQSLGPIDLFSQDPTTMRGVSVFSTVEEALKSAKIGTKC